MKEILEEYMRIMSEAPSACQNCERRHFSGCSGCSNSKYWDEKK